MGFFYRFLPVGCLFAVLLGISMKGSPSFAGDGVTPYIGIYGGIGIPETFDNVKGKGDASGLTFSDLKLKSGPMAGIKFGLFGPTNDPVASWFGIELDASYIRTKLKAQDVRLSAPGFSLTGPIDESKLDFITGALHLLVRYPGQVVQPYIGAGPAVIHARSSDVTVPGAGTLFTSGSATSLGLSGVAGIRLLFSQHVGAFFEYKHIRSALEFESLKGDAVVHGGVGGINLMF